MRIYLCDESDSVETNCQKVDGTCKNSPGDKCYEHRYVRADVAIRYAMMRERSTAIRFAQWYAMKIYRCEDVADAMLEYDAYKVKEAQQAWIKQNRGSVAKQSAQREYHIEKCHTCNRINTACVCSLREVR